jgi:hypothetical protein
VRAHGGFDGLFSGMIIFFHKTENNNAACAATAYWVTPVVAAPMTLDAAANAAQSYG